MSLKISDFPTHILSCQQLSFCNGEGSQVLYQSSKAFDPNKKHYAVDFKKISTPITCLLMNRVNAAGFVGSFVNESAGLSNQRSYSPEVIQEGRRYHVAMSIQFFYVFKNVIKFNEIVKQKNEVFKKQNDVEVKENSEIKKEIKIKCWIKVAIWIVWIISCGRIDLTHRVTNTACKPAENKEIKKCRNEFQVKKNHHYIQLTNSFGDIVESVNKLKGKIKPHAPHVTLSSAIESFVFGDREFEHYVDVDLKLLRELYAMSPPQHAMSPYLDYTEGHLLEDNSILLPVES